jgi:hypothetical protein
MNNRNNGPRRVTRRLGPIAWLGILGTAFMVALPQAAYAQKVKPPSV